MTIRPSLPHWRAWRRARARVHGPPHRGRGDVAGIELVAHMLVPQRGEVGDSAGQPAADADDRQRLAPHLLLDAIRRFLALVAGIGLDLVIETLSRPKDRSAP